MAITTDPWDSTELAAYIGEVWPGIVDEEFFAMPVAANFFTDLTKHVQAGGDIIHIPDVYTNAYVVVTQSTQGAEVTTGAPATVDDTLTINNHVYIADLLGDADQVQLMKNFDFNGIYNRKAVGTLVEDLEGDLFALHSSMSTNTVGDTASVINDTEIRLAIEKLASADVPLNESAFFFHPYTYWAQIIQIQKYYDTSQAGWALGKGIVITGNFGATGETGKARTSLRGQLFGIPIYSSSKVVNTLLAVKNILAHKSAIVWAAQTPGGSRIRVQSANWLANIGLLIVWDMMNGVASNREEVGVVINGSNAFIAS